MPHSFVADGHTRHFQSTARSKPASTFDATCTATVSTPMPGSFDSLYVTVAAILLYEAARRRRA